MATLKTSTYHAIGTYGRVYGAMDYAVTTGNTAYTITLSWLGEGWTSSSSYSSTYSQSNAASLVGKVNGTQKISASITGNRSYTVSSAGYSWHRGWSGTSTTTINRTTSSQSIPVVVTYTVSGTTHTGTVNVTVPALDSYTVTYNGNGNTGGTVPAKQTKYYNQSLTLSSSQPTKTGYTFLGWGTSSTATTATYCTGSSHTTNTTYTSNSAITLYAIWSKNITITYNGNASGSSNVPSSQSTTIYNATTSALFTISSSIPSLTNYKFVNWTSNSDGSGTIYLPEQQYSFSSSTILYAQWKEDYIPLQIENAIVYRTDSTGTSNTGSGSYGNLEFTWRAGSLSGNYYDLSTTIITAKYKAHSASSWTSITSPTKTDLGNHRFSYSKKKFGGSLSSDIQYDIQISIKEGNFDPVVYSLYISTEAYVIDVNETGTGIGFLTSAPDNGIVVGDNLTLYKPSGNSPSLIFQRGDLNDNSNDWQIYDKGGWLYFGQRGSGSTVWPTTQEWSINTSGLFSGTINWSNVNNKPDYIITQGSSEESTDGTGIWRWREWNSGKVEIWYSGSMTLASLDQSGTFYRSMLWKDLPNNYALYRCTIIISDFTSAGFSGCGGKQNSSDGNTQISGATSKFQIMSYKITAAVTTIYPNIYICGQKTDS